MGNAVQAVTLKLNHLWDEGFPHGQCLLVGGDLQPHLFYHFLGELTNALLFVFYLFLAILILIVREDLVCASQLESL